MASWQPCGTEAWTKSEMPSATVRPLSAVLVSLFNPHLHQGPVEPAACHHDDHDALEDEEGGK